MPNTPTVTPKKLRAGLVGLGMMGRHHARVLASLEGVELVGVCDPMGDPHGVAGTRPLVAQVEHLIALGIDYAMVAAPTAFHEELALALAAAGVHALIEKPLAVDNDSAERITAAFAAKGLVGAVISSDTTRPCNNSEADSTPVNSATSTRLQRGDKGHFPPASPMSELSKI